MKRVVNCILMENDSILMLRKPKRGWWVVPGGKIEQTETIQEAIMREYEEETNLKIENPKLKGVFNIVLKEGTDIIEEWMMFTFLATKYTGTLNAFSNEGKVEWKKIQEVLDLPKAEGDNIYLDRIINDQELITGRFVYTSNYQLISYSVDRQLEPLNK